MRKRSAIIITIGFLTAGLMIGVYGIFFAGDVFNSAKNWLMLEARHGNFPREIGTNKDLWLNGYLGIFFRFKRFGALNWLAIPLFVYFLITIKKRERWEIAICMALLMACIFICLKGIRNYRYQLTLFPVLITIVFLFGWQIIKNQNRLTIISFIIICTCLVSINCYLLREQNQYYWNMGIGNGEPGERFPYKLIEYINHNVADDSKILERNQPILYYYTSKKTNLPGKGKEKYILLRKDSLAGYDLVCEDQKYKLYKLKKDPDSLTIANVDKKVPEFETNFSNWLGKDEVPINDLGNTISPMVNLGFRGDFVFKRIPSDDGNIVRVMLKKPWFNVRPVIQFGYWIQPDRLNLKVKSGEIISFFARVRLNESRSANLFVQDLTDYWLRENVSWKGRKWQNVLVRRKIREDFKKICVGISWNPISTDDWLDIRLVRIFLENKEGQNEK